MCAQPSEINQRWSVTEHPPERRDWKGTVCNSQPLQELPWSTEPPAEERGAAGGMDVAMEWYYAVPLLFTVLAVVLASVFVKLRSSAGDKGAERAAAKEEGGEEPQVTEAKAKAAAADREGGGERIQGGQEQTEEDGEGPPKSEVAEEVRDKREGVLEEEAGAEGKKKGGKQEGEGEDAASRTAKAEPQSHPPEMKVPSQAAAAAASAAVEGEDQEDDEDEDVEEDEEESKVKAMLRGSGRGRGAQSGAVSLEPPPPRSALPGCLFKRFPLWRRLDQESMLL